MSEILYFEIQGFYKDNQSLPNVSCTFILGSQSIDSPIPTTHPIMIQTEKLEDTESLLVLFKQNENIIAKANSSLWSLRNGISLDFRLENLNGSDYLNKTNAYTWDHSYRLLKQDHTEVECTTQNPFKEQVLHFESESPTKKYNFKYDSHIATVLGNKDSILNIDSHIQDEKDKFLVSEVYSKALSAGHLRPQEDLLNKAHLESYAHNLETKQVESYQTYPHLSPEIAHLVTDLRSSLKEFERPQQTLLSSQQQHTYGVEEDYSPKFGKHYAGYSSSPSEDYARSGRVIEGSFSNKKIHENLSPYQDVYSHEQHTNAIKEINDWAIHEEVKESGRNIEQRRAEVQVIEGKKELGEELQREDDADELILEEMEGNEASYRKSADSLGSLGNEVRMDRNQDFLLEIKNQLGIKALTHLTDGFTRELVAQMSRGRKKVCAIRLKRAIKLKNLPEQAVETKSYFKENSDKKYLHYFQPFTKYLYLFNLSKHIHVIDEKPTQITLDIDFDISPHHKSVITPSGLIFIVSGKAQTSAPDLDDSSGSLHMYHYNGQTLIEKPSMSASRRKYFGLCYMTKNLFVVGGVVNGIVSNYCERFDIRSNEWLELAPMNKKLKDISICSFNNRYIYRFFGTNAFNIPDSSIERYDAVRDKWVMMNISVPDTLKDIHMPLCSQINQDHIFIFGGRMSSGFPSKSNKGYLVRIEDKRRSTNAEILLTKSFVSGLAGNFSQNSMFAHNGDIYFIRESN